MTPCFIAPALHTQLVTGSVIVREAEFGEVGAQSKQSCGWPVLPWLFAFHDTRRPIDEVVHSTGASTGEGGGSMSRYGGYCATSRLFEPEYVWDAARRQVASPAVPDGHMAEC